MPPARFDRRVTPGCRGIDLVVGLRTAAAGGEESVADLDALDGLDAHRRRPPAARRACGPCARTSRAPAAGRRPAPRRRRRGCRRRPWPPRSRRSSPRRNPGAARAPGRRRWRPDRPGVGSGPSTASPSPIDTTCETTSAPSTARRNCWATVPSATRAAVSRAEARSSTGRASSNPYFCMPARSACPGRGLVSGALRASAAQRLGGCFVLRRVGSHDLLPLRPLGVADLHGERTAHRDAVTHPAEQRDLVLLELHPRAAAVAEAAAGELGGDVGRGHRNTCRQSFEDGNQGGTMRFTCGEPAQHARHPPTPGAAGRSATSLDGAQGPRSTPPSVTETPHGTAADARLPG